MAEQPASEEPKKIPLKRIAQIKRREELQSTMFDVEPTALIPGEFPEYSPETIGVVICCPKCGYEW